MNHRPYASATLVATPTLRFGDVSRHADEEKHREQTTTIFLLDRMRVCRLWWCLTIAGHHANGRTTVLKEREPPSPSRTGEKNEPLMLRFGDVGRRADGRRYQQKRLKPGPKTQDRSTLLRQGCPATPRAVLLVGGSERQDMARMPKNTPLLGVSRHAREWASIPTVPRLSSRELRGIDTGRADTLRRAAGAGRFLVDISALALRGGM